MNTIGEPECNIFPEENCNCNGIMSSQGYLMHEEACPAFMREDNLKYNPNNIEE